MAEEAKKDGDIRKLNIYQKIAAITGEIGQVEKGGRNQDQKYDFIEYAAVAGKLRALFAKYGVVIVPSMTKHKKHQRLEIKSKYGAIGVAALIDFKYTIVNADDPTDRFYVQWAGEAADFGDKATNKAATAALKYYEMRLFHISEKGDDPDGHSPDLGSTDKSTAKPASKPAKTTAPKTEPVPPAQTDEDPVTDRQKNKLKNMMEFEDMDKEDMTLFIESILEKPTVNTYAEYKKVVKALEDRVEN